jgi:hypothetical protein
MELLETRGPSSLEHNDSDPAPRAVYIFLRPCLQTCQGFIVKYLNLIVRLFERRINLSHWGIILSTEHPPSQVQPGDLYKLKEDWTKTSSSFELDVPEMTAQSGNVNVGSFERISPTDSSWPRQATHVYLGTTTLSDEYVSTVGMAMVRYMMQEGHGYHGLFRNCQQFVVFMSSFLCPGITSPRRADQMFWGVTWMFKHGNKDIHKDMNKRVEEAREFYLKEVAEKIHAWKPHWKRHTAFEGVVKH